MQTLTSIRHTLLGAVASGLAIHAGCKDMTAPPELPSAPTALAPSPESARVNATDAASAPAATSAELAHVEPPAPTPSVKPPAPAPSVDGPAPKAPGAWAPAQVAPEPPTPRPAWCKTTTRYCLTPRTPPPTHMKPLPRAPGEPDPTVYDARGCVPRSGVPTSCSGMTLLNGPTLRGGQCCYDACQGPVPPCGRPLVVLGLARVAPCAPRADWQISPGSEEGESLDATTRARLGAAWLEDARLEHASIASFGRFALELLAVGAPPELVMDAHLAAMDEIEHARLCFGLASSYGPLEDDARSPALGPGRLPVDGLILRGDLGAVASSAVREGCLGETFAALSARRALEGCTHTPTRSALSRIARDELRHASLAFRFVAWALRTGSEEVRSTIMMALDQAREALLSWEEAFGREKETSPAPPAAWRSRGRLSPGDLLEVARSTRTELLGPCEDALRKAHLPRPKFTSGKSSSPSLVLRMASMVAITTS